MACLFSVFLREIVFGVKPAGTTRTHSPSAVTHSLYYSDFSLPSLLHIS